MITETLGAGQGYSLPLQEVKDWAGFSRCSVGAREGSGSSGSGAGLDIK